MDILNLPHFKILTHKETEHDFQIELETVAAPDACPHCGCIANLYRYGRRAQLIMDLPIHGKRVGLLIHRQRYQCRDCKQTFFEPLDHTVDEKRSATKRLVKYIEKQSLERTFVSISEDVGLDEKTIRNIFRDYINYLEQTVCFETPNWLGIDEIHIIKPRCVLTNIGQRTILDILPNRNKETVVKYLHNLPNKGRITYVTMDMWRPYKDAVKTVLPQAIVIVDKFHVVKMANQAMETVRKQLRESLSPKERRGLMHDRFILLKRRTELKPNEELILEVWIKNFEQLGTAYHLKESFFKIWDAKNKEQAMKAYDEWRNQIPPSLEYAFKDILTAVSNWHEEIFTYFMHPITNAYTESLNSLIRVMNRLGRGYSFEALRAKILFCEGLHKKKRPKYNKHGFMTESVEKTMPRNAFFDMYVSESSIQETKNYGVDISTLVDKLEKGEL
ncbi:ISL3 family transposase [Alicyclobacillus tolerans]|uniref:Transposase n=1 Tax=Alicyclobacillus tolerans TaxID=90970 RepID=A0A1M6U5E0_9BACL|nr:ISL3 family transposase [Alicyclobacillus montanus]SHK64379.1 Transposase [Alicyclobacillus montanus]SHL10681.1 Transposase [Alicyclobacillus montanus]